MLTSLVLLFVTLAFGAPALAAEGYLRDEVRVNLRSGPGNEFRILRVVRSGERLRPISEQGEWLRVRMDEGEAGWVPSRFVTPNPPPSVTLPKVQASLDHAESEIKELHAKLTVQTEAIQELTTLRERNHVLERENRNLVWADTWKKWLTGAAIAAFFLLVGGVWPAGGRERSRRIKL